MYNFGASRTTTEGYRNLLTRESVSDRLHIASLVAGAGLRRLRPGFGLSARLATAIGSSAPERLLIAPQDIRTADPTIANDIYAGYFSFSGKVGKTHGGLPFEIAPPSEAWAETLAGFGWLRHLRAADTPLARANARALVGDWMDLSDRAGDQAIWRPRVAARRLLSWLSQSPLILEGADHAFYRRFMKSLGRHAAELQASIRQGLSGEDRLLALIALAELGLCAEGLANLQRKSTRLLALELARQILPDGGHVSRNPRAIVDLLMDLLPLRQIYAARGQAAPPQLLNAIDRMLPMLRLFRMGDGSLALFNGMGVTALHRLAIVLSHDDARAAAMLNAPYSGYQRLEAGDAALVMDAGPPPAGEFSRRAHAGCLSFEFTARGQRIVVNCGAPSETRADMRQAARTTAAHSTLTVADTSSCQFASGAGSGLIADWIVAGPRRVEVAREEDEESIGLVTTHDGYVRKFNLKHHRDTRLARDGSWLRGEDRLTDPDAGAPTDQPYALRFHLDPGTRAAATDDGHGILLTLPNGARWAFQSSAPCQIEESIYFGGAERARGSEQIVIHATTAQTPAVAWSFARLATTHDGD